MNERAAVGTGVHVAIATGDWTGVDPGYRRAYRKWVRTWKPEFVAHELAVYNRRVGYAGRLDALVRINGLLTVIDWKTGRDIYPDQFMQTEAYRRAVPGATDSMIVRLAADGSMDCEWDWDQATSWRMFRTFKTVYDWTRESK